MELKREIQEVNGDVLIVGGGMAATMAAVEARKQGLDVVAVDKGKLGLSGSSPRCGGAGNDWALLPPEFGGDPNDSHDAQLSDCVKGGEYINVQEMTEIFGIETLERMVECESLGIRYPKRPDGKYNTRKLFAFSYPRGVSRAVGGSLVVMGTMRQQLLARGVAVFDYTMITRLLKGDGRICGAFGFNIKNGQFYLFKAKSVILAAGSATGIYKHPTCENELTGDSYYLAYHAGAKLMNMEFLQFSLATKVKGIFIRKIGGIKPLTNVGARWINALGEPIMEKYDPARAEMTDWWRHAYAVYKENAEGRGPVYMDVSRVPDDEREAFEYGNGGPHQIMRFLGYDPKKEKVEVIPGLHTFLGGARINAKGETNIPGLYAAGEAGGHGGIFGADRVGGGIPAAQVVGHRAGKNAAEFSLKEGKADISRAHAKEAMDDVLGFVREKGEDPYDEERSMKDTALECLGICRNGRGLKKAVDSFSRLNNELPSLMKANDLVDLQKALEVRNLALAGEMVSRAAFVRKESRGQHRREDFPLRDDKEWLKWIVIHNHGDQMKLDTIPVPIETYKVRPS